MALLNNPGKLPYCLTVAQVSVRIGGWGASYDTLRRRRTPSGQGVSARQGGHPLWKPPAPVVQKKYLYITKAALRSTEKGFV